jgi:hypothetical protein
MVVARGVSTLTPGATGGPATAMFIDPQNDLRQ